MNVSGMIGLTDTELVARLASLCSEESRAKAEIVAYLVEVEERRVYLDMAYRSMFEFCTDELKMSPGVANHRIAAARLAGKCPSVLDALVRGELSLCTLVLIKDHVTPQNARVLLDEIRGMSFREVQLHLAKRAPKPDVPDAIVPVAEQIRLPAATEASGSVPAAAGPGSEPSARSTSRIAPLAPGRFEMLLSIGEGVKGKFERARDLLRHRNAAGTFEFVLESALDALFVDLEKELRGKTEHPRPGRSIQEGEVSTAARREVFARDGERCTFEAANGRRCTARGFLEIDHIHARAIGGSGEVENLRVLCRAHNRFLAEKVYGRDMVDACIERSRTETARRRSRAESVSDGDGVVAHQAEAEESPVFARSSSLDERVAGPPPNDEPATVAEPDDAAAPLRSGEAVAAESTAAVPSQSGEVLAADSADASGPSRSEEVVAAAHLERSRYALDDEERSRALRGLTGLGFKRADALRALDAVLARALTTDTKPELPVVVRDAIRLLA